MASKMYATVQTYFAHWQGVPGIDLDARYRVFLAAALAADDRRVFDLACLEFLAQLRNGHTDFHDRWLDETHGQPLGFRLIRTAGRWVVTASRNPAVQPGTVVRAVDGVAVDDLFARNERYIAGSSRRAREHGLSYASHLFPPSFTLTLVDGREVRIDRQNQELAPPSLREVESRTLTGGVAYLRVPTFGRPECEDQAVEVVKKLGPVKALIIDIRGNGGGNTPSRLIDALMDRPYPRTRVATPLSIGLYGANGEYDRAEMVTAGPVQRPGQPAYTGPLLLLTDGGTGSAAEDFAIPFKVSGRARVVGEATAGTTGQPFVHDFGNGMGFRVSSKRESFPDGSPFEGVGVTPDVTVTPTLDDLRAGRDVVLEKARELTAGNGPAK